MSGILEFMVQFGEERQCIAYLAELRWPGGYGRIPDQAADETLQPIA